MQMSIQKSTGCNFIKGVFRSAAERCSSLVTQRVANSYILCTGICMQIRNRFRASAALAALKKGLSQNDLRGS